jgi:hypothetical protein
LTHERFPRHAFDGLVVQRSRSGRSVVIMLRIDAATRLLVSLAGETEEDPTIVAARLAVALSRRIH